MSVKQCTQLTQLLMKIKVLADTLDPQTDRGKCEHHIATIRCSIIKQIKRYKVNLEKTQHRHGLLCDSRHGVVFG